jgi:hypothetical protein
VDAATMLLVAVRRKLIGDLVSAPESELLAGLRPEAPRRRRRAPRRK